MRTENLSVDACVTIQGACPAEYIICGRLVEFHFGGLRDGFHFAFDVAALRRLAALSAEALAAWDASAEDTVESSGGATSDLVRGRNGGPPA
jgi:hypothetical protein